MPAYKVINQDVFDQVMSAPPREHPPSSPTPSKSSLRRTSGSQNPSVRNLVPLPSPRFGEQPTTAAVRYSPRSPPNQTLEYDSDADDSEDEEGEERYRGPLFSPGEVDPRLRLDEQEPEYEQQQLLRPFQPFFVLIEDSRTAEHYHPSVHYVFADDDQDIVTQAATRSLGSGDNGDDYNEPGGSSHRDSSTSTPYDVQLKSHGVDNREETKRLPSPHPEVKEHYLVVDIQPVVLQHPAQPASASSSQAVEQSALAQAYAIANATSLSPDWQIFKSAITSAPTMGEPGENDGTEGFMLRIEGQGPLSVDETTKLDNVGGEEHDDRISLEERIEKLRTRLSEIKTLIVDEPALTIASAASGARGVEGAQGGYDEQN